LCAAFAKSVRKRGKRRTGDQAATAAYPSLAAPALVDGANLPLVSGSGGRSDRELLLQPICKGCGSSNLRGCEGTGSGSYLRERERESSGGAMGERDGSEPRCW